MKSKKRIILIAIIVLIIFIFGFIIIPQINKQRIIKKGYIVFGDKQCKGHSFSEVAGQAFTEWTCDICGKTSMHQAIKRVKSYG